LDVPYIAQDLDEGYVNKRSIAFSTCT